MQRQYHRWWSPSLGREMELLVLGHSGARMLVFPTSRGRFYEWEDRGMFGHQCLGHHLTQGWLQAFCVDSVDDESWYNHSVHPGHRGWRQTQYLRYITDEVLPLSIAINPNPFLITAGASFGAYHAICFAFKYPHLVGRAIGMSGIYDIKRFTNGYSDDNVYFNNPMDFIQHEHEWGRLEALRRIDIILAVGRDDPLRGESEHLSAILWRKGIGNALRIWDGWAHDWPYWQRMMQLYVGGHD
ncbi:MAG: esterase family protein [Thermoflexales bacterium]